MKALRTPAKNPTGDKNVGENSSIVRRSIGKFESGQVETELRPSTSSSMNKTVTLGTPPKVNAESPPKSKYANKTSEARACLTRAKLNLRNAKNLKTEIRVEVVAAVERLYQLVKEAENGQDSSLANRGTTEEGYPSPPPPPTLPVPRDDDELLKSLNEHSQLMKDSNEKIEQLKQMLEEEKRRVKDGETYASVAAVAPREPTRGQTALHSIVVTSKNETDTGEQVLNKIRDVIQAKEGWVKVEKIRKTKDRKIIVGCKTEGERDKVKERLKKANEHLQVEEVKNKDPLLILKNILKYNSDDDVLSALRKQNADVFEHLDPTDNRMEIRYKRNARNPLEHHIVLRVSPKIWQRMLGVGAVHIDLQRIWVADQTPLVQCSLCLGYGHGRRFCTQTIPKCSHCGGSHMRNECADFLAGAPPTCCNCAQAKLGHNEHNAFSQECAVRRRWDALARTTIAYC